MNREDIIRMALEAYIESNEHMLYESLEPTAWVAGIEDLERFANLVAAAEREACAKVCEDGIANATDWDSSCWDQACENRAETIRAQGD